MERDTDKITSGGSGDSPSKSVIRADEDTSKATLTAEGLNTGHGDFCFGRWIEQPSHGHWYKDTRMSHGLTDIKDNNVLFVELGGFKRNGSFPYVKLPIEIRLKIVRLLLGPYYNYDENSKESFIEIEVLPQPEDEHGGYEAGSALQVLSDNRFDDLESFNTYFSAIFKGEPKDAEAGLSDMELEGTQAILEKHYFIDTDRFNLLKKEYLLEQKRLEPHPLRKKPYKLVINPKLADSSGFATSHYDTDGSMFELVRNMSNVSRQFRQELGSVFWSKIRILDVDHYDIVPLANFLDHRPAVLKAIKHLKLCFKLAYPRERDPDEELFQEEIEEDFEIELGKYTQHAKVYKDIGSQLHLDELQCELICTKEPLGELVKEKNVKRLTDLVTCFNVSRAFSFKLVEDWAEDPEEFSKLIDEYSATLETAFKPTYLGP